MSNFGVGMKVVCVDNDFPNPVKKLYQQLPVKGETYTVRCIFHGRDRAHPLPNQPFNFHGAFLLEELHNPEDPKKAGAEIGFKAARFRPVVADY